MKFKQGKTTKRKQTILMIVLLSVVLVLLAGAIVVRQTYTANLKPLSDAKSAHVVTIEPGSTTSEIADMLLSKGVIRSDWAFEWYIRNHELRDALKAGTYLLYESQSVPEIVTALTEGKVATDLVTILPGKRLDEIKAGFLKAGFKQADIDAALDPAQYTNHPALTDKPKGASLEGYLYPESFQKTAETTPAQIVKLSLNEMQSRLTPEIRRALTSHGLSLHQSITLAAIVEREVSKPEDRVVVAQVFYKRLRESMRLESDATNDYAKLNPAYDTYSITGLPPGPIGNVTEGALKAVAYPAETDWLYFVSGDDGRTHFSKTLEEHQEKIKKYCTKRCG
jgi:UPF0755 protein